MPCKAWRSIDIYIVWLNTLDRWQESSSYSHTFSCWPVRTTSWSDRLMIWINGNALVLIQGTLHQVRSGYVQLRAKLHYTDISYGHHQQTSSQQVADAVHHVRSWLNLLVQHRPKLHYTDTGYRHVQHHQRMSSQQFYNKLATSQCQSPTSRHVKMLGCGKFLSVDGEFVVQQVVELLWAPPLVVSVAGEMLYNKFSRLRTCCTTSNLLWACPLVVFMTGVRSWCPCSGVRH